MSRDGAWEVFSPQLTSLEVVERGLCKLKYEREIESFTKWRSWAEDTLFMGVNEGCSQILQQVEAAKATER